MDPERENPSCSNQSNEGGMKGEEGLKIHGKQIFFCGHVLATLALRDIIGK